MHAFHSTTAVIQAGIDKGLHYGLQIYVSRAGRVLLDAAYGEAHSGAPLTTDTLLPWLSAGKPLMAVAVLMLVERGQWRLDRPIADVIPEFAGGRKDGITLWHLLTHTSGIRKADYRWPTSTWSETLAAICESELEANWVLGETAGYHLATSWYVLGELVRRIDGRDVSQFLRDEICAPLEMRDTWNGLPEVEWREYGERIGRMWQREAATLTELPWHDAEHCGACSPGGNTRGPIRELGRFYECLLAGGLWNGRRLLSPETVSLMTRRHRVGRHDLTFQHVIDFGLGFIVNSHRYGPDTVPYGYGARSSEEAFGHGGSQSSIGFADPARGLVVTYVANGRCGEGWHQRRHRELIRALEEDLGAE